MAKRTELEVLFSADDKGLKSAFGRASKGFKSFDNHIKKSGRMVSSLRGEIAGLAASFVGITAIQGLTTSLWDAGLASDNLNKSFTSITGSSAGAARELDYVREMSSQLGLSYRETANSYKRLLAASQGTSLQGQATQELFKSVVAAGAAVGASADEIDRAFIQISQGISRGRFELEDLKTIAEALPGVGFQDFANAIGVSTEKLFDMVSAGEVVANDFVPKLTQVLTDKFGKAAVESADSAQASLNRFKNAWFDLKAEIANAGFMDVATNRLGDLTAVMKDPVVQEAIKELVNRFFDLAEAVFKFVEDYGVLVAKIGAGVVAYKALSAVVTSLTTIWGGMNAAMIVMTGTRLLPWVAALGPAFAVAAGKVALLAGAFGAAYKAGGLLYSLSGEGKELQQNIKDIAAEQESLGRANSQLAAKFADISRATGVTVSTMKELDKAVKDGKIHYNELTGEWERGAVVMANATMRTSQVQRTSTIAVTKEMTAEWQKYANAVKSINDDIAGRSLGLKDKLNAMSRTGMSEYNAWKSLKRDAQEYEAAARRAFAAGDFDNAVKYADKASDAYEDLNKEVKDGERVMVSSRDALKTAMDGVASSGEVAIAALEKQKQAAEEAADVINKSSGWQLGDAFTEAGEAAQGLAKKADMIGKKYNKVFLEMRSGALVEINRIDSALDDMARDRTVTVHVKEVTGRQYGGLIQKFATGGRLPGYGGGDRIPALLEAGEFVVRKEAVAKFGSGLFSALNSLRLPKFSSGGEVFNVNLALPGGSSVALQGKGPDARQTLAEFARMRRFRSQ